MFGAVAYVIDDCQVGAAGHIVDQQHVDLIAPEVQSILRDDTGVREAHESLSDLTVTGFQEDLLQRVLAPRDTFEEWRVGEALAELHLKMTKGCVFPWPDSRSTKNPGSSGGGVDLIGFQYGDRVRFVFAEVKTSHQQSWPPTVLTSRSHGLHSQLMGLNAGDQRSEWAIRYLAMNGLGRPWYSDFRLALKTYLANTLDVVIYGMLIHVCAPNEADLKAETAKLAQVLAQPTTLELVAIYIEAELLEQVANASVVIETAA